MNRRTTWLLGWLLAAVVAGLFAKLGFWQLDRATYKQAMLDAAAGAQQQRSTASLALAGDLGRANDYDLAEGDGHFVAAPAILLDNQQREGRVGVRVYRLFQPSLAGSEPLLVELGWLPLPGDRTLPDVPRPQGPVHVVGLLAPPPAQGIVSATPHRQANGSLLTIGLDAGALASALQQPRLPPRILKLSPDSSLALAPDYRRDATILPNTLPPQRHIGYAVQWFALALTVLITALVLTLRKPRQ